MSGFLFEPRSFNVKRGSLQAPNRCRIVEQSNIKRFPIIQGIDATALEQRRLFSQDRTPFFNLEGLLGTPTEAVAQLHSNLHVEDFRDGKVAV